MNSFKKGNSKVVVIVVVIIILAVVGFIIYRSSSSTGSYGDNTASTAQTKTPVVTQQPPAPLDTTDASIDADVKSIDANMAASAQDSSSVDSSLNDKPVSQEY